MKKTISVIGCGWLGLPLSKVLACNGYNVKGSTTHVQKFGQIQQAGASPYFVDIKNRENSQSDFFKTDYIVVTIPPSSHGYFEFINNLIDAIELNVIKKVIFISSTSVYPNLNRQVFENDAQAIVSKHSRVALLNVEKRFADNQNFETTVLRFAGLYGPGREPGRFLRHKSAISGSSNPINLIHLEDCITIIVEIIKQNIFFNKAYNACADEHPAKKEFYVRASISLGLDPPDFNDKSTSYKIVNSDKLKQTLDYRFIHSNPLDDV